jgi:hypothetical protein
MVYESTEFRFFGGGYDNEKRGSFFRGYVGTSSPKIDGHVDGCVDTLTAARISFSRH